MKIAALLTCFNRKDKTLACLKSLFNIIPYCHVYLVDDGSTDGTSEAIKQNYPQVNLIKGNGNLFWSRGMYTAWKEALHGDYDYYLWVNDDMTLYENFLDELISCEKWGKNCCVVSGLVENLSKTEIIYGGCSKDRKTLQESKNPQEIIYMNGNLVLIPKKIVQEVGIIDPHLHHDLGDVDYGFMVIKHGYKVYSTRKAIGCSDSTAMCRVRLWNANITKRFKRLYSPLGSNPNIAFYFRKKHYGIVNAIIYWFYLHFINILPDNLIVKIFGNKYLPQ